MASIQNPNPNSFLQAMMESPSIKGKVFKPASSGQLTSVVKSLILTNGETNVKDPFFVLDLGVVAALMDRWTHSLPGVVPFYAVKCNPDPDLLAALAMVGSGFDCATKVEIVTVLALGVSADRIVFSNPCKLESDMEYAASVGVNLTTFDSEGELKKIRKWHPTCSLLLRIKAPENSGGVRDIGTKYGAVPEEFKLLLEAAREASLSVVGVSFHVGTTVTSMSAFAAAVEASRAAFDAANHLGMPPMTVLDVGGGFLASGEAFEEAASAIKDAVREHFSGMKLRLIGEPGRFFAETAFGLAVRVVGKRVRGGLRDYWINDGIHGSFMGIVVLRLGSSDLTCMPLALHASPDLGEVAEAVSLEEYESTVYGPTCDSCDRVLKDYRLPELEVDDWLVFPDMGAYSSVFKSSFNGFNTEPFLTYLVATLYAT